jgi:hypothetical protein
MGGSPTTYRQQAPAPAKTELAEAIVFKPDEVKKKTKGKTSKLAITSNAKNAGTNTGVNKGYG